MPFLSRKDMDKQVDESNQQSNVENARVVTFLGKDHIHIDYRNGDIGVISEQGVAKHIPVGKPQES